MKRAKPGNLVSIDIGIAVHRGMYAAPGNESFVVSMTPSNIEALDSAALPVGGSSLVMSLHDVTADQLRHMRKWSVTNDLPLHMAEGPASLCQDLLPRLLSSGGCALSSFESSGGVLQELLESWSSLG